MDTEMSEKLYVMNANYPGILEICKRYSCACPGQFITPKQPGVGRHNKIISFQCCDNKGEMQNRTGNRTVFKLESAFFI